jgi:hypothetical protein
MRHCLLFLCFAGILLVGSTVRAQSQAQYPGQFEPPGKQEIAKYPLQLESPLPPSKRTVDPVKLHAEAQELFDLARSVPADMDQVSQGKLPKDIAEKLKRIEKLSKHLRGELAP